MSAVTRPRCTIDEYVRIEEYANLKHEYFDGQVWAMAGGTPEHARWAFRIGAAIIEQLRGKPCAVYSSDARIRVTATGLDTYPDVSVVCGGEQRDTGDPLALTNPIVLVEVTSEGTEAYDRGEKFEQYKRIDALKEYVLVSHRDPSIEVFRRNPDGRWTLAETARSGGRASLASIGCEILVDDVFLDPFTKPGS
jgi:Uma2 family endonuclease